MKKSLICLLFSTLLLTACSSNKSQDANNVVDNNSSGVTEQSSNSNLEEKDSNKGVSTEDLYDVSKDSEGSVNDTGTLKNISEEVKNYILNGQGNKPEAEKLKWSETFLNEVDIDRLYNQYLSSGGNGENIEQFASYMTLNAPILSNWEDLFKKDLYDTYSEEVVKLEELKGDLYQAYIEKDGKEVPYVVVSSRTGYFHG
ncbi:hypothetical protein ACQPUY_11505 [Clostridium nigeriense]|uniref:hypothetical protein n=1 Tax=Clostridium nigeriense TaxID=1805470 RepID=UPI003D34A3DA